MKATLSFNLPEEQGEFDMACKAGSAHAALWDVGKEVFRPARKHGYSDPHIQELLGKLGDDGELLVGHLERKFYEILEEHKVELT